MLPNIKQLQFEIVNYNQKTATINCPFGTYTIPTDIFKDLRLKIKLGNRYNLTQLNLITTNTKPINTLKPTTVLGKVIEKVKGGFKVKVKDNFYFLPNSQTNTQNIINKYKHFTITPHPNTKTTVILSRKQYLESKKIKIANELANKPDKLIKVKIKNITKYGIFATYKAIDGLIKIKKPILKQGLIKQGKLITATFHKWNETTNRLTYKFHTLKPKLKHKSIATQTTNTKTTPHHIHTQPNTIHSTHTHLNNNYVNTTDDNYYKLVRNQWSNFTANYKAGDTLKVSKMYKKLGNWYIYQLPNFLYALCKHKHIKTATIKLINLINKIIVLM